MDQIIKDAYYLISIHQKNGRDIDINRLNNLLYLLEIYYMCKNDGRVLYYEGFNFDAVGIYNKTINNYFNTEGNIILSNRQIIIANMLYKNRKQIINIIYSMFGNLSDLKLRAILHFGNSPISKAYNEPSLLIQYIKNKTIVSKELSMIWFKENILKNK